MKEAWADPSSFMGQSLIGSWLRQILSRLEYNSIRNKLLRLIGEGSLCDKSSSLSLSLNGSLLVHSSCGNYV